MKALVYQGAGQRGWDTVSDPAIIDPTTPGSVLGHDAVGPVQEIGANVSTLAAGDRTLLSCTSSCGRCHVCKEGRYDQCLGGGGWIFGQLIDELRAGDGRRSGATSGTPVTAADHSRQLPRRNHA